MSSIALPFENMTALNIRATRVISISRARQPKNERKTTTAPSRSLAFSFAGTILDLYFMAPQMQKIIGVFESTDWLNRCSPEEIKQCAHGLNQAAEKISSLIRRYEKVGIAEFPVYRPLLERIREKNDRLESIVEGLHMSISGDFAEMMATAAEELLMERSSERGLPVGSV